MFKYALTVLQIVLMAAICATAQHRGDDLAFQGLQLSSSGVKATAMGQAFTARSGDLESLYHNPAGLSDITRLQISAAAHHYGKQWRENQVYRPNRMFWTMAFYLEGLYTPDPKNNGKWDYEIAQDTSYHVTPPVTGLEPFSEEAADWQKKTTATRALNLGIALPLKLAGVQSVLSAAYSSQPILDFDRNDTYLDPHIGYDAYGFVPRVVTDTVRFSWSRFTREREGDMQNLTAAVAVRLGERLNLGAEMNWMQATATDHQSLNRVGYFDIAKDNRFRFSYDTLDTAVEGESKFSAAQFKIGVLYKFDRLNLGMAVRLPYTVTRKWDYATRISGAAAVTTAGEQTFEHPAAFSFGASVTPIDPFRFMLDYEYCNYSQGKMTPEDATAALHHVPDLTELRCGMEFKPFQFLALLAGYRYSSATFVPDGAAIKDIGPAASTLSFGASLSLFDLGRLDIAYEMQRLNYYDSYFSNTNYVHEAFNHILFGYTYTF